MTDISKLRVSLTKHGAHKVTTLLRHFSLEDVLENTSDQGLEVNLDRAQVSKILGASAGKVPLIWQTAKELGDEVIDALVFTGIVFSHATLIKTMQDGASTNMAGAVVRDRVISGKEFSNFKNDLIELRLSTNADVNRVDYDLRKIIELEEAAPIINALLRIKLQEAGWDGNNFEDECVSLGFHKVFALEEDQFKNWLARGDVDSIFSAESVGEEATIGFAFQAGHNPRKKGTAERQPRRTVAIAKLKHNELQDLLYELLCENFGEENVSTENPAGTESTSIDAVCQVEGGFEFYELKTNLSIRLCIREAFGQVVEYSHWPSEERAQKMFIVGPHEITESARRYMRFLKEKYSLPIYYIHIDEATRRLSEPI